MRHLKGPAHHDVDFRFLQLVPPGQVLHVLEDLILRPAGHIVEAVMLRHELRQPEVLVGFDLELFAALLEQTDEGHESAAIQTALVQIIWRPVARRHHNAPALEEPLEESFEYHGVGDVNDVELVKAQQLGLSADVVRHLYERVGVGAPLSLVLRLLLVQPGVHVQHELVEVHALLGRQMRRVIKAVHDHGLALPNAAPDIQPLDSGTH
mmetsp:Transcript_23570/g.58253  ORF Transcript_23570/g.58253 Transcript_23570/m.58253 type:complete len:209 (+) Transcript_23570:1368-1994(+)